MYNSQCVISQMVVLYTQCCFPVFFRGYFIRFLDRFEQWIRVQTRENKWNSCGFSHRPDAKKATLSTLTVNSRSGIMWYEHFVHSVCAKIALVFTLSLVHFHRGFVTVALALLQVACILLYYRAICSEYVTTTWTNFQTRRNHDYCRDKHRVKNRERSSVFVRLEFIVSIARLR